jgi:DNA-binding response OmpR family regulator
VISELICGFAVACSASRQYTRCPQKGNVASHSLEQRESRPSVLVIDDDLGTRETFTWALAARGLTVASTGSGVEALEIASRERFDLVLIDLRLPDMLGTDLARAFRKQLPTARLILVSGFLTTRITVEAVKLGIADVIEKPVALEDLLAVVDSMLRDTCDRQQASRRWSAEAPLGERGRRSKPRSSSAAERWAINVLKACESRSDVRTLDDWASYVGLSYSSLCESCRLLRIRPHDARDLARMLRAVLRSRSLSDLPMVLDVSDMRTLNRLLVRAGLNTGMDGGPVLVDQFLRCQRFVASDNEALIVLKQMLASRSVKI